MDVLFYVDLIWFMDIWDITTYSNNVMHIYIGIVRLRYMLHNNVDVDEITLFFSLSGWKNTVSVPQP